MLADKSRKCIFARRNIIHAVASIHTRIELCEHEEEEEKEKSNIILPFR